MSTYRDIVYMVLDQIKVLGGDQTITEGHVIYLANKYRAYLIKAKVKAEGESSLGTSNYQTVCLSLEKTDAVPGLMACNDTYLRSEEKIPSIIEGTTPRVESSNMFATNIAYVSAERFAFVGYNKYMRNIIYCTLGSDNHLYFKSNNPQFIYMDAAKMYGVFEDSDKAAELACGADGSTCDILDSDFPLDEELIPSLIDTLVKVFYTAEIRPEDSQNNDRDDMASMVRFINHNMKSDLAKQLN